MGVLALHIHWNRDMATWRGSHHTAQETYTVLVSLDSLSLQITEILNASPVWSAYKDQKHDLFLTETTIAGYLTGPTGVAGYITAGTASANTATLTAPPPLIAPPDDTPPDVEP